MVLQSRVCTRDTPSNESRLSEAGFKHQPGEGRECFHTYGWTLRAGSR